MRDELPVGMESSPLTYNARIGAGAPHLKERLFCPVRSGAVWRKESSGGCHWRSFTAASVFGMYGDPSHWTVRSGTRMERGIEWKSGGFRIVSRLNQLARAESRLRQSTGGPKRPPVAPKETLGDTATGVECHSYSHVIQLRRPLRQCHPAAGESERNVVQAEDNVLRMTLPRRGGNISAQGNALGGFNPKHVVHQIRPRAV